MFLCSWLELNKQTKKKRFFNIWHKSNLYLPASNLGGNIKKMCVLYASAIFQESNIFRHSQQLPWGTEEALIWLWVSTPFYITVQLKTNTQTHTHSSLDINKYLEKLLSIKQRMSSQLLWRHWFKSLWFVLMLPSRFKHTHIGNTLKVYFWSIFSVLLYQLLSHSCGRLVGF